MPGGKDWNTLFKKAQQELSRNSIEKAVQLFEEAEESTLSSKEKMKALTEVLYIYMRSGDRFSYDSTARICKKISKLLDSTMPQNALLYKQIEEYYIKLQKYVDEKESSIRYEPLLIKIKDCFLQMENFFATALVYVNLGSIAIGNIHINEKWQNKQIHYFRECAYLFEKLGSWNDAGETYKSLGIAAREQKKFGVMEDCFLKSAECFIKSHKIMEAAKCYEVLCSENGLTDITKRIKYAILSIEYSIAVSDITFLKTTIFNTEKLIESESDTHKRRDYFIMLAGLAVKGEEYSQAAELYEKMCKNPLYNISKKQKKEFLALIPELIKKQKIKYKEEAESYAEAKDYLSAATTYIKLAELTKIPGSKWLYQFEAALCYGYYRIPVNTGIPIPDYIRRSDIQRHYDLIEKQFTLALHHASKEKEKKVTIKKAQYICKELAQFYGEEFRNYFTKLGELLAERR
ncbi:MAG: hypothetical protein JXJ04_00620 [Spirochaetales bacterium]|nr:hypothetical protein [Spirochaetales bacterium]